MIKLRDILLKENYEFILSDKPPMWTVTVLGLDLKDSAFDSAKHMKEY